MPCLNILGYGFLVFEQIVCRFDGIRAAAQLWDTPSRMDGHRLCDLLDTCDASDIAQLRSCKLFFCPFLWFLVHTNLQCITSLFLVEKTLYFTMPQREFWVMTSTSGWRYGDAKHTGSSRRNAGCRHDACYRWALAHSRHIIASRDCAQPLRHRRAPR